MKISNWISEKNVKPFIRLLAATCGHEFETGKLDIILRGITDTHTETGKWFEYRFVGKRELSFRIGHDAPGTGVIKFKADCPKKLGLRIEAYMDVCQSYTLTNGE